MLFIKHITKNKAFLLIKTGSYSRAMRSLMLFIIFSFSLSSISYSQDIALPEKLIAGVDYEEGVIQFKLKPIEKRKGLSDKQGLEILKELLIPYQATEPVKIYNDKQANQIKSNLFGQEYVDLSLWYQVRINNNASLYGAISKLLQSGLVDYAEPRYISHPLTGIKENTYIPNDPFIDNQYSLGLIQAFEAWAIHQGDTNQVIGISDTGTDLNHPDLINSIKYNYEDPIDGTDNDNDGFIDNYYGWDLGQNDNNPQYGTIAHGVHVCGIASATADNGTGIAGSGFKAKFMPLKIADESGILVMSYESIVYAADHGCQVINCSWGSVTSAGQYGQDIINYAVINKDAVVIAAGGNANNKQPYYPASYQNVLSVAATNNEDVKWENSSYGITIDISAPGSGILSTWPNGTYISSSGSSMAAPLVSGCAALLRSYFPDMNATQIIEQIIVTTDPIDEIPGNVTYTGLLGSGRINLFRALTETWHPSVKLINHHFSDYEYGEFQAGDTLIITGDFINYLASVDNMNVDVSSESPWVEILTPSLELGPMPTMQTVSNVDQPIKIKLLETCPPSQAIDIKLIFSYGSDSGRQYFSVTVNRDYINISPNQIETTITSKGRLGYNKGNMQQGQGFIYNSATTLIKCAGLVAGNASTQVSDAIYGPVEGSYNEHFVSMNNVSNIIPAGLSDMELKGVFTDEGAGTNSMGLKISHTTHAWENNADSKYIIQEYCIKNQGTDNLGNFYVGFYADWEISDNKQHRAAFDADLRMGYAYSAGGGSYTGIRLLSEGDIRQYSFDNTGLGGSIKISDGFTGFEKFTALRTNRFSAGIFDPNNDISMLISSGPYNIVPGDSITVAFAIMAGDHLADLKQTAQQAYNRYVNPYLQIHEAEKQNQSLYPYVYPNPSPSKTNIRIISPKSQEAQLIITDIIGKVVYNDEIYLDAGKNELNINLSALKPGTYYITVRAGQEQQSAPLFLIN